MWAPPIAGHTYAYELAQGLYTGRTPSVYIAGGWGC